MHKYFIKTFGCQMNFSDSERMMTFFRQHDFSPAKKIEEADLVVFNTCGVRQTAEDRVYGLVHNLRTANQDVYIVITGCLSHRPDVQKKLKGKANLFLPIADFHKIPGYLPADIVARQPANQTTRLPDHKTARQPNHYLCLQPQYKHTDQAFVPIMTGCNNFCSYCVVPYARGREWSRPMEDIVAEMSQLSDSGCREVILLGQNVNSYQYTPIDAVTEEPTQRKQAKTKKITFPLLLDSLAKRFTGLHFKFLTSHPKDFSVELMKIIAGNENISKDIHLPIQSGSDRILKAMNRPYTQEHYMGLVEHARLIIPHVRFSTDVIVGFPGETEEDFQETASVFRQVGFYEAFINKYSPRPGTAAFSLGDPIAWNEKKRREKVLRPLIRL